MSSENQNDAIPAAEEEQPKVVSIWDRLLAQEYKSTETKTYKKSGFAKIMKIYKEKRDWAESTLAAIRSPDMKLYEENVDLEGDSYSLFLIMQNYAEFFADYSAVIFKHELLFADVPFRAENKILSVLLLISKEVPELEPNARAIICRILNVDQLEIDLIQIDDMTSEFRRSLFMVDRVTNPNKKMGELRFIQRMDHLADVLHQSTGFVMAIFTNWRAMWNLLGITQYLPCTQVLHRIRLARWLGEFSRFYTNLLVERERVNFFEMMGIEPDSEFTTAPGSLRLIHPSTYAGQEDFAFLFEE
jgi:hypothetical protein